MNLKEAIKWAERDKTSLFGDGNSKLVYYVIPWNDDYCVVSNSHIERNPDIEWVYNTKDKEIIDNE